jgi:hypothetical protein
MESTMRQAGRARLWVLVTDGRHARIVMPDEVQARFRTTQRLGVVEPPYCPPPLPSELAHPHVSQFIADVAGRLNKAAEQNDFDELVLVAPRDVLHGIRLALQPCAMARLIGTLHRDLASLDDETLSPHLVRWWVRAPGGTGTDGMYAAEASAP